MAKQLQPDESGADRRANGRGITRQGRLRSLVFQRSQPWEQIAHEGVGYVAAALGVAAVTLAIAVVQRLVHVENISLLYLLVVLWLAATFGRGPAIVASVLAFLAYDFFFIPPLYHLTVGDPTQWLSLFALLATALVLGQLTAIVQARAHEARESQERTATLYSLAQLLVSTPDQDAVLAALAERIVSIFGQVGILACGIILPDAQGWPITHAAFPTQSPLTEALSLEVRERAAQARWALEHGKVVGNAVYLSGDVALDAPQHANHLALYLPLRSTTRIVGVLGIAGTAAIRRLIADMGKPSEHIQRDHQQALFAAFCDQIALALDRTALQQQAIHTEALRESDRLKNTLLGSVTHDLRTPLAAIQTAAESLREPDITWNDGERNEFLDTITTSVDRLNRLVSNLLDLSRLEAGAAVPEKEWYPIGDVIATVLDRLDLAGRMRGRHVEIEAATELPLVPLDHAQIEQVLTNLIENALKYSPAESTIRVRARIAERSSELVVSVADQGIGIPSQELHAIFDKFYRVQYVRLPWASQRPPVGTGLGLAICANIIRAHEGRIWAESRPREGATFFFTLPIPLERPRGGLPELDLPLEEHEPGTEAAPASTQTTEATA